MAKEGVSMQIGVPGKKYGLSRPAGISFFNNTEDEEEGNVNKLILHTSTKKTHKQSQQHQAKVLAEDPTAYDYDSVYDSMHKSHTVNTQKKDMSRKPRYINALLEKAAIRNKEQDIIYSRMLQKERETEGNLYAGKEKFLTSAYKKKLQENKLWQEEEDRKAALEEDVTNKEDLGSFYMNLLTHNEAYGAVSTTRDKANQQDVEAFTDSKICTGTSKDQIDEDKDTRDKVKNEGKKDTEDSGSKGQDVQQKGVKRSEPQPQDQGTKQEPKEQQENKHTKLARGRDEATISAARERYLKRKAETQQ